MSLFILIIFLLLISFFLVSWLWFQRKHSYWLHHKIPHVPATPFIGSLKHILFLKYSFGDFYESLHKEASKGDHAVMGFYMFQTPALLIREPELIKKIFVKNAQIFPNRYEAADPVRDLHGSLTLPLAKYPLWNESRKKLSHLFTTSLIQSRMFPKIQEVCEDLSDFIERKFEKSKSKEIIFEVKEMCNFFTLDVTASLMYSLEGNSLKNEGSVLSHHVEDLFRTTIWKTFNFLMVFFLPHLTGLLRVKVFPHSYTERMRDLLKKALRTRSTYRGERKEYEDLIDFLLELQKESPEPLYQKEEFLVSQVAIFLLAGYETSSSLMALLLYEMAKKPALQEKLRQELQTHLRENREDYDYRLVKDLPFLNSVVSEGLRLYPTASFINREHIPLSKCEKFSLQPYVDYEIPSGMPVYVSVLGLHRDEKFWPDPENFDPERFSKETSSESESKTSAYIPFGCGPHACIGSRLGLLQVKMALIQIFQSYRVSFCSETLKEITFDPRFFMLNANGDIKLKFQRI